MRRSGKFSVSSLSFIFRIMVTAVFLFGLLPLPALAQNDGTLAGQVTDNATNPVAGATVLVFASGSPTPGWNASTNASGGYNVTVPEGNDYRLSAVKAGFITGHAPGQNVTANATTAVNFSLAPGGIIQGAVSDNASSPIQGASVRAFPAASPQNTYDSLPTNPSGQYSVTVPPGPGYTVVVNAPGFATANQTNITATQGSPVTVPFTLEPPPQAPPQDSTPPANVTDLAAVSTTYDSVTLAWTAPGDDASTGQAAQYEIRYAATSIGDATAWDNATPAQGVAPPQPAGSSENFTVSALTDNTTYFFAIKTRDDANLWSGLSNSATANTTAAPPTPFFNIAHSQNRFSFMLAAGDNITETFNVTSVNSFAGTVNLQFNGPPEIASSSVLFPTQVTLGAGQTQPVSLTLGASAMTPSGNYQVGLGGQTSAYGGQQRGFFFSVNVGVAGQALLSASPSMVAAGAPTNFFASQFTPGENVTLRWDSGPSVGVTLATGQIAGDGAWTAQVTIPADTPGGNFAVKAVSASNSAVFQLTITSGVDPDFAMSASPQFVSIPPGNSGQVTIYLTSINGFGAPVTLSANAPPGVTGNLSAASVTPGAGQTVSATLSITVADWASPDMFHINIEGSSADPAINRMTDVTLDIPPPAAWGPGLSLSQSYGQVGDTITLTGSNFPPATQGQTVTIKEVFTDATLPTSPQTITVNAGGFTGTVAIPQGIPSGNYRLRAVVPSTSDFAERDFQILGTGETYSLGVSPQSTTVTTEQGANSATVSVNIYSVGGSSPAINLAIEGAPSWLTYQFGSLPVNTPASGNNSVTVPAGGSASRNLSLTASLTAPSGNYAITVKGWVTGGAEQRVSLELTVQPPAGFGMAQITLSPNFGGNGQNVNFSGSGFTDSSPSQVTEIVFGQLDLITGQSLPTITVPTSGASAGKFSGSFRVPGILPPGSYPVKFRVGTSPNHKFVIKSFTITGPGDTFVLQASPSFLWAEQGHQVSTLVKVQAVGSSSPNVSLSLEGLPADISANFSSSNITAPPGGVISTDLNLSISDWLPAGHYTITIKGQRTGTAEVHRIPLEMDIVPPAGFGMASIYLNPTVGPLGTWITISGSGFPASTPLTHLYFGPPNSQNDRIASLPSISTDGNGALSAVLQVPPGLTAGNYPVEVVVGTYPDDRMANSDFTLVSDQASFNINLSPTFVQAAPGTSVSISVNMQSFGNSSANITLRVEGPPNIEWRFDGGGWQTAATLTPPIGGNIMSSLEIQPKASTPMGHYSLAVKATAGAQQEFRNLEIDVGASAGYGMPIFSINPSNGTAGTTVSFSGSNFPTGAQVLDITFGGDNITLAQQITTSPQGSFSGSFTVPASAGGQAILPGSYLVRVTVAPNTRADVNFNVYGSDDTFTISLSPNFLQGEPGGQPVTSGILKALGGAAPTVKMAVKGLPPGVTTGWNGVNQPVYTLSAPPGGQNYFDLTLVLPGMIPMGQYPAGLEGWVDTNDNNVWDEGEKTTRVNLELSIMPPQGYGMGMLTLTPNYGRVGDTITFAGSGFPAGTAVQSLTFAQTNVLSNAITTSSDGSFSGVFTVPANAFGMPTGPGKYPVDVIVGTPPDDRRGGFDFQVVSSNQKFSVGASPGWLARPAGETASVS
ncbi:MAG TPA: carboxypeptidase regulatory-like domain-containing protein, partial [Dehalococcoidales bacterium]|nr:carboxypeptidase regulatory-like domain-containing protein [Dehalococcoidales bacterium]